MMGYFGVGIWKGKHECNEGGLWRSARCFGASFCFTVGMRFTRQASDTTRSYLDVPMYDYTDIEDLLSHLPYYCPLIGVELDDNAVSLEDFHHPSRAIYCLGSEDNGLSPRMRQQCHHLVQVPGASRCLNVASTGSIVLYDRYVKLYGKGGLYGRGSVAQTSQGK